MKQALVTTRRRIAWGALFCVATPPVLFDVGIVIFAAMRGEAAMFRNLADVWEMLSYLIPVELSLAAAAFLLFGAPIWLLLHRRQAGALAAALCGLFPGAFVPLTAALVLALEDRMESSVWREVALAWPMIVAGAVIGALTAAGAWRVAYRKPPPPRALAEVFA